ncbi:MAG: Gfo/Idh/MocA family oxidoreductase [Mesorhizobium sp.]
MEPIRIGVIGAGGIVQVEHLPNLLRLPRLFDVAGVVDPSARTRGFVAQRYGLTTFPTVDQLFQQPLDAVLVASPDPLHKEHVLAGLGNGLHVFCEKPLCYSSADIAELIAARDRAGRVLQVGYMKRFDPSYEALLELMPGSSATLRQVSVEVHDPDAWPFVRHHETFRADDVSPELIADTREKQRQQVARAVQPSLDALRFKGFCGAYCSSLVHDVNAVNGLLDRLGVGVGEVTGAALYAGGDGGHGSVSLNDDQALWTMSHLTVPGLPDYRERITLYFDDSLAELEFPSPYLNHHPTRLTVRTAAGERLATQDIRAGFEEAFVEELKGFWSAVTGTAPVRNTAEDAARDMDLLCRLARHAAADCGDRGSKGDAS